VPETRAEKSLFVLGILAIAALGFLIAHLWHHTHGVPAVSPSAPLSTAARSPSGSRPASSAAATTRPASTSAARKSPPVKKHPVAGTNAPAKGGVSLLLVARIDTWLEVRSASSTGHVLYSGTLVAGSAKSFRARSIWARFGAAGNLSARLNRKELRLPSGTYDAIFDSRGFQRLGG
jgi:uncharacterized protein DUF4115